MTGLEDSFGSSLSPSYIRRQALNARILFCVEDQPAPNILHILENVLPDLLPGFLFKVVDDGEIGGDGAHITADPLGISFEETTYKLLGADNFRARATGAHELGHLFLHPGSTQARNTDQNRTKISAIKSVEAQANRFMAEFLLPHEIIKDCSTPLDVSKRCIVSVPMAERRMRDLGMWPKGDEKKRVVDGFETLLKQLRAQNN